MKKLVCDRCGNTITEKIDVELALEGKKAWAAASKARCTEPRGIIPCENYVRCHGEMILVRDYSITRTFMWITKVVNRRGNSERGGKTD